MKVYEIRDPKDINALVAADRSVPSPGYGEVLVRLRAASLNYRDLAVVRGAYGKTVPYPIVPLSDGAGEVVELGTGASRWSLGDRVAGIFMQSWLAGPVTPDDVKTALGGAIDGVLSEYRVFPEHGLVQIPPHLSFEEAAALPCAAVTAWHALKGLQPGESVLVQGSGGVSVFALQFAKMAGARVIATSSSDQKLERLRALGADVLINYKATPDWDKLAHGVDRIVEVGGSGTLGKSIKAVRMGGLIASIGVLTGPGDIDPRPLLMKSIHLQGIYVGSRLMFEEMNRAITQFAMKPVLDHVFPFSEAPAAYGHLESGAHFGKVVIGF